MSSIAEQYLEAVLYNENEDLSQLECIEFDEDDLEMFMVSPAEIYD